MVTCSYNKQEFFRVGYYVNVFYEDQELNENPPNVHDPTKLYRHILAENPRVTRFPIEWDKASDLPMSTDDVQVAQAGEHMYSNDRNELLSSLNVQEAVNTFSTLGAGGAMQS